MLEFILGELREAEAHIRAENPNPRVEIERYQKLCFDPLYRLIECWYDLMDELEETYGEEAVPSDLRDWLCGDLPEGGQKLLSQLSPEERKATDEIVQVMGKYLDPPLAAIMRLRRIWENTERVVTLRPHIEESLEALRPFAEFDAVVEKLGCRLRNIYSDARAEEGEQREEAVDALLNDLDEQLKVLTGLGLKDD